MDTSPKTLEIPEEDLPEHIDHTVESTVMPTYHAWVQKGNWITCVSCQHTHAFDIGINKRLKSIDEFGMPVFEDC